MSISEKVSDGIKAVDNFGLARAENVRSFSQRHLGLDKYVLTYIAGLSAAFTGFTLNYANHYDDLQIETIVPLSMGIAFGYCSKRLEKLNESYPAHFYRSVMNFARPLFPILSIYSGIKVSIGGFSGEEMTREIVSLMLIPIVYFASLPKEPPKQLEDLANQEN